MHSLSKSIMCTCVVLIIKYLVYEKECHVYKLIRTPLFLGCQINLTKALDGIQLELPKATRNFYVDGHTPISH